MTRILNTILSILVGKLKAPLYQINPLSQVINNKGPPIVDLPPLDTHQTSHQGCSLSGCRTLYHCPYMRLLQFLPAI